MPVNRYTNGKREVEAEQISAARGEEIAAWCGGSWHRRAALQTGEDGSYLLLAGVEDQANADNINEGRGHVGDFVMNNGDGTFSIRSMEAFENAYDEVR